MPIINKGVFEGDLVYIRQTGNDWPTAQVTTTADVIETSGNLYFTNARVFAALSNGITGNLVVTGTIVANSFVANNLIVNGVSLFSGEQGANLTVTRITANIWNGLYTANVSETPGNLYFTNSRVVSALVAGDNIVIEANGRISANATSVLGTLTTDQVREGNVNLYFTNTRVVGALSPGKGISIGSTGIISSFYETQYFNTLVDGTAGSNVMDTFMPILTLPSIPTTDTFILESIHIVNISDAPAFVSANVAYKTGNTATLANQIPIPAGGVLEFIKNPQILQAGDKINMKGFTGAGVAANNLLSAIVSYQTISDDVSYTGLGQNLANSNTAIQIFDSYQGAAAIESIKFVNLHTSTVPIKAWWTYANSQPIAYFAHNLQIPPNSSVELLQRPKKINLYDKMYASYSNAPNASVAVFVSAKLATIYSVSSYVDTVVRNQTFVTEFTTSEIDGTILYYTVE